MDKTLNREVIEAQCAERGLNQSTIAEKLGVTRAAVSKWFTGKSFPRPAELLQLGRLLELKHREIVSSPLRVEEPRVAFRKRGSCKTTDAHIERAKEMGRLLRPVAQYLDFDPFLGPPSLKNPRIEYRYVQELVAKVRRDLKLGLSSPISFTDLISMFHDHQAVIIPALWGKKTKHENALHVYLPDSKTTWIYLNLDVEVHDFKFWMAHELGHVLTIDLLEANKFDEAEDFAEHFAGALLFPEKAAEVAHAAYQRYRSEKTRLQFLCKKAREYQISPFSVYVEMQHFAQAHEKAFATMQSTELHRHIAQFNKDFQSLSEVLFDGITPTADHFMRVAQESFGTEIFKALGAYIKERSPSSSMISSMLGTNPMDGRAYFDALSR